MKNIGRFGFQRKDVTVKSATDLEKKTEVKSKKPKSV